MYYFYSRGPNKYTRTWEDEEAYRRQNAAQLTPRKPPNPEDFPELDASKRQGYVIIIIITISTVSCLVRDVDYMFSKVFSVSNDSLKSEG